MTTETIKIVGMTLVDAAGGDGMDDVLASFACEFRGLRFNGCMLRRFRSGSVRAFPPKLNDRRSVEHAVHILDAGIRNAMTDAAHRAYLALRGIG